MGGGGDAVGASRSQISESIAESRSWASGFFPVRACEDCLELVWGFRLARRLRMLFRGTPGLMPKQGWVAESMLRRLATAGARVWPLKTPGWQKIFMRRVSELLAESSSIHCQSLRARERREAVWGLVRR